MKKFLIIGCGRSGTGYMAKLFQSWGYDVGHEVEGKDGTANWYKSYEPVTKLKEDYEHVIHIIRNPVDQISSGQTFGRLETWLTIYRFVPEAHNFHSKIELLMWYWLKTNQLVRDKKPDFTLRIEHIRNDFKILPFAKDYLDEKVNAKPHSDLTINDLEKTNNLLWQQIKSFAQLYGYKF